MGGRGGASHRQTAGSLVNGQLGRDPRLMGFREFVNYMDADAWHMANSFDWTRWNQILSSAERSGIEEYTSSLYSEINAALRESGSTPDFVQRAIQGAKAGLAKWEASEDFVVYRGANLHWTANLLGGKEDQLSDANFLRSRIGKRVTDKGFMSAAVTESKAWTGPDKVLYKIYVRKGTSGMYVEPVTMSNNEYEYLFNSGSRFVVHEIKTDASGRILSMTLEAMPTKRRRR